MKSLKRGTTLLVTCLGFLLLQSQTARAASTYLDLQFYSIRDTIRDTMYMHMAMSILPESETEDMSFTIHSQPSGGDAALWGESIADVPIGAGGLVHVLLGTITPLSTDVFADGAMRYLQVTIDGQVLAPRIGLVSATNVLLLSTATARKSNSGPAMELTLLSGLESEGASASAVSSPASPAAVQIRTTAVFTEAGGNPLDLSSYRPRQLPQEMLDMFRIRRARALINNIPRQSGPIAPGGGNN